MSWRAYLKAEDERGETSPTKSDVLLAQIACQVYLLRETVAGLFAKRPDPENSASDFLRSAYPRWNARGRKEKRRPRSSRLVPLSEWKHIPEGIKPPPVLTKESLAKLNEQIVMGGWARAAGMNPAQALGAPPDNHGTTGTNPPA